MGGGIAANLLGNGDVTLVISNCVLFNGSAVYWVVDYSAWLQFNQLLQLKVQTLWIIIAVSQDITIYIVR